MFILLVVFLDLLVFLNFAHSRLSIKTSTITSSDSSISLLTYNIFEYSIDGILDVLIDSNADILSLQEVDLSHLDGIPVDGVSWLANELNFYHFEENSQNHIYGVTLLSRWPIIDQYSIELNVIDGYMRRVLLVCTITSPFGDIVVMSTHLQQPNYWKDRVSQIQQIIQESRKISNVILLGDFNTIDVIIDKGYRLLAKEYSDGWIASGKLAINGRTWPAKFAYLRVDYIWLTDDWKIIKNSAKTIGDSSASDHKAVYLEVSL
ncbi:MAG: endonuclease/exonuclease/phosphatase family protein [Candidatus Kariarchaeaceae archaeon]